MRDLIDAGVPVGLGVDGAASNEAGRLVDELRSAMVVARLRGGPQALTAREALRLATMGGARCLGREAELGSLEPGKLADVAVWRLDGLGQAGGVDPVFCWAFSSSAPLRLLLVNGRAVVAECHPADRRQRPAGPRGGRRQRPAGGPMSTGRRHRSTRAPAPWWPAASAPARSVRTPS